MKEEKINQVGILLYEGIEMMDIAGPAEAFSATSGFKVICVGQSIGPIRVRGNITLLPDYSLDNCPHLDVLIIPGSMPENMQDNTDLHLWLQAMSIKTNILMSVCSGTFLLAAAGLLEGKTYTTSQQILDMLQQQVSSGKAVRDVRYVDSGNIITTAGALSCIDGALQVIKRLQGAQAAQNVAEQMEHESWLNGGTDPFLMRHKNEITYLKGNK